jgi:putative transposase
MNRISYRGHRFPPDVIPRAVWLYLRFTLSLRDVENLLAERGVDVTYETIRCWVDRFRPQIARRRANRAENTEFSKEVIVELLSLE